jgi:hypothetical protein
MLTWILHRKSLVYGLKQKKQIVRHPLRLVLAIVREMEDSIKIGNAIDFQTFEIMQDVNYKLKMKLFERPVNPGSGFTNLRCEILSRIRADNTELRARLQSLAPQPLQRPPAPEVESGLAGEIRVRDGDLLLHLQDFFRVWSSCNPCSAQNEEEYLYEQFIVNHPKHYDGFERWPRVFTQDGVVINC